VLKFDAANDDPAVAMLLILITGAFGSGVRSSC
jgi:hypothetical protein